MDGLLVLNTPEGAYSSTDGGDSWQGFGPAAEGSPALVALEPYTGRVMSANGGKLWSYRCLRAPWRSSPQSLRRPATRADAAPAACATNGYGYGRTSDPCPCEAHGYADAPASREAPRLAADGSAQPLDPAISDFFEQTKHNIKYGFRDYWHNNGEVAAFGYPISEEFTDNGVIVQYFERARLEYRDGKIVVGLLGTELTAGKFFQTVRFFPSEDDKVYFGPTQHSVSGPFLTFWRDNGGLETFGYPLSESIQDDGSEYQWFERARLEWHPWLAEGHRIVLGSIGTEALKKRGWLK